MSLPRPSEGTVVGGEMLALQSDIATIRVGRGMEQTVARYGAGRNAGPYPQRAVRVAAFELGAANSPLVTQRSSRRRVPTAHLSDIGLPARIVIWDSSNPSSGEVLGSSHACTAMMVSSMRRMVAKREMLHARPRASGCIGTPMCPAAPWRASITSCLCLIRGRVPPKAAMCTVACKSRLVELMT